ncbi:methionyl-tRNA formyltransferase [Candidatus Saccharibacteria bacterium TM7i]|nr:methionyl-tRNA formyltransferase [Candidatus Saccharibacteria bacterium TM7i]
MNKTLKTVLFFGTDDFSAISLRTLIAQAPSLGVIIGGVITKPDARKGRGRTLEAPIVKTIAEAADIPVFQPSSSDELMEAILKSSEELPEKPLGVLVSYGRIIPQRVIDLFEPGIINVHPSLLPLYRGPSPVETAIWNGDAQTGVSIMQLSAAMDAGPVYAQETIQLTGKETGPALLQDLGERGAALLCDTLPGILEGTLTPTPQDDTAATYCHLLAKEQATLDPTQNTAEEIDRHVRAFLDFPKTKLIISGQPIVLRKVHPTATEDHNALILTCKDNTLLCVKELIGPSGKQMSGEAFKNGYIKKETH